MDRGATEGTLLIELGGRAIEYRFARRRRRTVGLTIDAAGLRVAAPTRASWHDVERFLRDKGEWILRKLDEWASTPCGAVLRGETGEVVPVFGAPRVIEVRKGRRSVHDVDGSLIISSRGRTLDVLVAWLKDQTLATLRPRVGHYAALLGLPAPVVGISNARTQWGVCTERGAIRLSWRLAHVDPALADYVVAHEVAHLVELNHSRRYWNLLERLYPGWREARERLELSARTLPILKGKR
ncbi:MAG TPA: SprT family zinc-dependent metalloprotease [Burkholderiales bacterium]|nr:SprT family zinc-dependent metalloprotease [Burkholderiales bacterium]